MDIREFIKRIEEEFDSLKPGTLNPESLFKKDVRWDSLRALTMIALVDVEYDVKLNEKDLMESHTINDLFQIIIQRMS